MPSRKRASTRKTTRRKRGYNYTVLWGRLIQWSIFTVGVTVIPLLISFTLMILRQSNPPYGYAAALTSGGELLFSSAAIFAEAISDLLKRSQSKNIKNFFGGICVLGLMFSIALFVGIQSTPASAMNRDFMVEKSYQCFQVALLLGLICKVLAKG